MKKIIIFSIFLFSVFSVFAQEKIYDDKANAMSQIQAAVKQAQDSNKYVFCQVGGNWCPWCIRFASFVQNDSVVNKIMHDNFVYIHVNWSKDNKNAEAMKYLGNPARFGFPVFVILDDKGNPIHIQNSAYLEEGKGYNPEKVADFLKAWTAQSVNTLK